MTNVQFNLSNIRNTIPSSVSLMAVSKFHPAEMIQQAYDVNQRIFGENKVQELVAKQAILPKDIQWHFIGHLQTNKVKSIIPFVSLIHSVDSLRLLEEINKQAQKANRIVNILLQIHIAAEETKFGFTPDECIEMLKENPIEQWSNVQICGVMGMATFTEDEDQIRSEFRTLKNLFNTLKENFFKDKSYFKEISCGMSEDYKIAIEEGSTIVRIGSSIFGERNYNK